MIAEYNKWYPCKEGTMPEDFENTVRQRGFCLELKVKVLDENFGTIHEQTSYRKLKEDVVNETIYYGTKGMFSNIITSSFIKGRYKQYYTWTNIKIDRKVIEWMLPSPAPCIVEPIFNKY